MVAKIIYGRYKMNKIYDLYVDGKFKICDSNLKNIANMKRHVIDCWNNAQYYGFGYYTNRPFPVFEIR